MENEYAFGNFLLDTARGMLLRNGVAVPIGQRGMQVLQALLEARGRVVDKARLFELAWPGLVVEDSNLSVQIATLRKALGRAPDGTDWIVTVPRLGYRFVGATPEGETYRGDSPPVSDYIVPAQTERPSIAVLPFVNLSADSAQEYFVDGITDDVIAALTRFRWFFVTGRSPSFTYKAREIDAKEAGHELGVRYLVQGSVRKVAERARIAVKLIDATSGHCLWAEHYDFDLTDVFAVQDQIAQRVAGAIEPELLKNETGGLATRRRTGTVTGWDLVARGCSYFHQVTQPTHHRARELFRQARQIDPESAEARIWLARVDAGILAFGWSEDVADMRREGMEAALEAVQMDEKNCYAHYSLAIVSVMSDAFDLAIRAAEKAVEVSPSFALGHLVLGMAKLYSGDAEGAVAPLELGLELNRHDPHNFVWYNILSLSLLLGGDAQAALRPASLSLKVRPQWRSSMQTMAACCAALGRSDAAREWREQVSRLAVAPGDGLQPLWRCNAHWVARMSEWLGSEHR